MHDDAQGRFVDLPDTKLWVVERGPAGAYPLVLLHGGPGDDHHEFGDYLDPLAERGFRLILVDQRANGKSGRPSEDTWTLPQMATNVVSLAREMDLGGYAVLGHSYGAFVALQNAVDHPGAAAQTIVSSGVPSARFLAEVERDLAVFEPVELRDQVTRSWAKESSIGTQEELAELMREQMPFHFADPLVVMLGALP